MTKFKNHSSAIMQQTSLNSTDLRVPLIKQEYNQYSPPPAANSLHHNNPQQQQHHSHYISASSQQDALLYHHHQQQQQQHQSQQQHHQHQLQDFFSRFNTLTCSPIPISENNLRSLNCSSYSSHDDQSHLTPSPIFTDYDENSSISSEEHVLAPLVCSLANSSPPCLTWACKACKKKSVTVDRRNAATIRERQRLRKVGFEINDQKNVCGRRI